MSKKIPKNPNHNKSLRFSEPFSVNFANTESYQQSAIPFCQRLLNEHFRNTKWSIHTTCTATTITIIVNCNLYQLNYVICYLFYMLLFSIFYHCIVIILLSFVPIIYFFQKGKSSWKDLCSLLTQSLNQFLEYRMVDGE